MAKIELSDEMRSRLEGAGEDLTEAEIAIDKLDKLGVDVSTEKRKLVEARTLREGLLREF